MAYREFHFEKTYAAPDTRILARGLERTAENMGLFFRSIAEAQRNKRIASDQYKFDLGEGKFENDDKIFFQQGLNITQRGKMDIRRMGRISPELEQDQNVAIMQKKQSDWQFKKFEQNEKEIKARETEDKYYDGTLDREGNKLAAYGENNDVYYATRGERLDAFDKIKFLNPQSLKGKVYTSDYVKAFGKKEQTKTTSDPNSKSSVYSATPFLTPQGTPGVTVDHAKEYLSSRGDGSVARWIENLVDQSMDADVKYMRSRSDKFKNMSDEEAKLYLKANPQENLLNKKDYATRVIEKAQEELAEAADIARKTDYETKVDKSITGGLYNNDAIGHSYTDHTDNVGTESTGVSERVAAAFGTNINQMPGGNIRIGKGAKIGNAIPVDLNPKYSVNMRNGKISENKGTTAYNLTGYQLSVFDTNGKPVVMNEERIRTMPLSEFKGLSPNPGIALRGYTIEQGNKLGEIASRQSELDDQLSEAINSGDVEKEATVRGQIQQLAQLRGMMNLSPTEFSSDDLLSAFKQNGISVNSIKRDVLVTPSEADLELINRNLTRGLNLNDKNKWSQDMRDLDALYRKRYAEAQASGFRGPREEFEEAIKKKPAKARTIQYNNEELQVQPGRIAVKKPDGTVVSIPESQRELAIKKGYTIIE